MVDFEITKKEMLLAFTLAFVGFVLSMHQWVLFMNMLDPFTGLLVYYAILYVALFVLSRFKLIIWKLRIKDPLQVLGALLITMAFFITVDWESPWIQVVTGNTGSVSNVLYQSEDGAFWYLWSFITGNPEILRLLTYVLTPFILAIVGAFFVSRAQLLGD
jgi:hypothetical protein